MKRKIFNIVSLILNIIMAAMAIFVFTRVLVSDDPNKYLEFQAFTYDSNLLFLTAALLTIVFDIISLIKANKKLPTWVVFINISQQQP